VRARPVCTLVQQYPDLAHAARIDLVYNEHRSRDSEADTVKSNRRQLIAICLLVMLSMTIPSPAGAQSETIRFERISVEDGLSETSVQAILQDKRGFMWFGTEDGLNKYDGYQFTVYKHDLDDDCTLSDDDVRVIYEDRDANLWIGTAKGLNLFDRTTETFTRYQHNPDALANLRGEEVLSICEDDAGALWVGTMDGGLNRLDQETNSFAHYFHDPDDLGSLSDNAVWAVRMDSKGNLWIGTDGGLNRFDPTAGSFVRYRHDPSNPNSLSSDSVRALIEDHKGMLWIGTEEGGLNRLDLDAAEGLEPGEAVFYHFQNIPGDPLSLGDDRIRTILEDETGQLWLGTDNGLGLLDLNREYFTHYRHDPGDLESLGGNYVQALFEDRSGVLWVGTGLGGLSKYNRAADQFTWYQHRPDTANSLSDNAVYSIYEDRNGLVWIGTREGGLNKLDRIDDTFTVYQHDPDDPATLSSNQVRTILEDHTGALWVGTRYGGLARFDPRTETFTHYTHDPNDPGSLSEDWVSVIYQDRAGDLWMGTWNSGLERLDRATGGFVHYRHDPDDPTSLSSNNIRSIHEDQDGVLWVGTSGGGISLLDRTTSRFTHYAHDPQDPHSLSSNDSVLCIYEEPTGTVWAASYGGGLNRFDRATESFSHYTEKDGLPDDLTYCILGDSDGFLWISTNRGLSKFDPRTETFRNFTIRDGLQSNEFNYGACFQNGEGEMFFGGTGGFNVFHPAQIKENSHIPPVIITAFSQFNEVVRTDLPPDERILLSHNDSFISFDFAALDYVAPGENQYAYMMEGLDKDWIYVGTHRHADFRNLRPGDYIFRVKGSNNDGVWNEEGVALRITVTPPFWGTWWFQGIAGLLVVGSVLGWYRLRVRTMEARSRDLELQVQRRTQELESLYRADEELVRHLELDQVLQALVDVAVDIFSADKSSLMVWDQGRDSLIVAAARGFSPETIALMSFPPGEGTVGLVAATGEPAVVEDARLDSRVARRITEPEGICSFMHVPIRVGGDIFGVFNVDYLQPRTFGDDELRLFEALAQRAALAIENAQLYEGAHKLAAAEERQRLARDLHDAVTQTLFSASLIAEVLPDLWEADQSEGRQLLGELRQLSRGALAEMRTLLLELRPAALMETSLGDLLRQLGEAVTGRKGIPVEVVVEGEPQCPPDVQVALYRITQEALNNVVKHSKASLVTVGLQCQPDNGGVELCISDDGRGFDPTRIPSGHLGVGIMHERARAIGATLEIESELGAGTRVVTIWRRDGG
jgi:signal transduction histidine kinase/ligand-binding sensor domain-containing protein